MNVIFVEPFFPNNQRNFVRALAEVGATVIGIGEYDRGRARRRAAELDAPLRAGAVGHRRRPHDRGRPLGPGQALGRPPRGDDRGPHAARRARARGAARSRAPASRTAWLCRDKPAMKEALRAGRRADRGLDRARPAPARSSVRRGRRLPADPQAPGRRRRLGHGPRRQRRGAATRALGDFGGQGVDSIAVEEFVEGHEGFYDTLAINGHVAHDFVSHYYPNVLEAMRTRWIKPQFIATNRIDSGDYGEVREMGRRVIEALGIGTSATHMEWFYGPKGLRFSEIGCRPPGVGAWDLYSAAQRLRPLPRVGPRDRPRRRARSRDAALRRRDRGPAPGARRHDQRLLRHRRRCRPATASG